MSGAMRSVMVVCLLGALYGCTTMGESGYSSRMLPVTTPGAAGYGYIPQACLADDMPGSVARLPPGCANELNLVAMAVNKEDLHHGQEMGPAMVAPAVNAVERYLGVKADDEQVRQQELKRESRTAD